MRREEGSAISRWIVCLGRDGAIYVKSPLASLCFICSSLRKRVRVMMSVLMFSWPTGGGAWPFVPLEAMVAEEDETGEAMRACGGLRWQLEGLGDAAPKRESSKRRGRVKGAEGKCNSLEKSGARPTSVNGGDFLSSPLRCYCTPGIGLQHYCRGPFQGSPASLCLSLR